MRVKFANLIASANGTGEDAKDGGLLGWIDGINLQPQIDQGFIIQGKTHYPKTYKLSIKLNVLHEHELGFGEQADAEGNKSSSWIATGTGTKWPFGG